MSSMTMTACAQLRFVASILFGLPFARWSLDTLISAAQQTRREFGALGSEAQELLHGPALDDETRREFQQRRFRKQAQRAARETRYYRELFARLDIDLRRLSFADIARIPLTTKEAVRANPDAFIRESADVRFRATTSGTTGWPTSIAFSEYEMQLFVALQALSTMNAGAIQPDDIVQISTNSRAALGNLCNAGSSARLGALVTLPGQIDPDLTLALLRERHTLPGKKERVSKLTVYPSYLGALIERGLALGYGPHDFGLEQITTGGEIVSAGLKRRAQQLFGPVTFQEGFGMTEVWPFGGTLCSEGHLHWEPSAGLLEVIDWQTGQAAQPCALGTLVLTPFPPFRETTLLLRYNTEDVVRVLDGPLTCSLRHQPATSHLLGKQRLAVQHDAGWTFPRQIVEALEALDEVPLPARCGYWAVPGGVAVEVLVRDATPATRRAIERSLQAWDVPVRELYLHTDRSELLRPLPWRGDLREGMFAAASATPRAHAAAEPAIEDVLAVR
ncbi:MAG: phenylacetate--CoA ligase family protein [Chloroflexi bacterium]|nr:phenylacetate--CoA ligase family protein [Chloroflexota bacterium]